MNYIVKHKIKRQCRDLTDLKIQVSVWENGAGQSFEAQAGTLMFEFFQGLGIEVLPGSMVDDQGCIWSGGRTTLCRMSTSLSSSTVPMGWTLLRAPWATLASRTHALTKLPANFFVAWESPPCIGCLRPWLLSGVTATLILAFSIIGFFQHYMVIFCAAVRLTLIGCLWTSISRIRSYTYRSWTAPPEIILGLRKWPATSRRSWPSGPVAYTEG